MEVAKLSPNGEWAVSNAMLNRLSSTTQMHCDRPGQSQLTPYYINIFFNAASRILLCLRKKNPKLKVVVIVKQVGWDN